jgi:hypothetical protein
MFLRTEVPQKSRRTSGIHGDRTAKQTEMLCLLSNDIEFPILVPRSRNLIRGVRLSVCSLEILDAII